MSEVKMDIKPNSHRYKAEQQAKLSEEKKVSKVTSGRVRTKKKSEIAKMKDSIISPEASGMQSYIFGSVLIPAVKKLMSDIVKDGIDILLYGDTRRSSRDRDDRDRYSNGACVVANTHRYGESSNSVELDAGATFVYWFVNANNQKVLLQAGSTKTGNKTLTYTVQGLFGLAVT